MTIPAKKWAHHYDACISCGTTDKKHNGHGLCTSCFTEHTRRYASLKSDKDIRNFYRRLNYKRGRKYNTNHRMAYEYNEDRKILHGLTDRELAKLLGRSVSAIQVRRAKLNKHNNLSKRLFQEEDGTFCGKLLISRKEI